MTLRPQSANLAIESAHMRLVSGWRSQKWLDSSDLHVLKATSCWFLTAEIALLNSCAYLNLDWRWIIPLFHPWVLNEHLGQLSPYDRRTLVSVHMSFYMYPLQWASTLMPMLYEKTQSWDASETIPQVRRHLFCHVVKVLRYQNKYSSATDQD
jgi:hypothetical protein